MIMIWEIDQPRQLRPFAGLTETAKLPGAAGEAWIPQCADVNGAGPVSRFLRSDFMKALGIYERDSLAQKIVQVFQGCGWFFRRNACSVVVTTGGPAAEVMAILKQAGELKANLLLNTGPLPDGSIDPDDVETLREVGEKL